MQTDVTPYSGKVSSLSGTECSFMSNQAPDLVVILSWIEKEIDALKDAIVASKERVYEWRFLSHQTDGSVIRYFQMNRDEVILYEY